MTAEMASAEILQAVTQARVRIETGKDPLLLKLMVELTKVGGSGSRCSNEIWDGELLEFKPIKDDLRVHDDVLYYGHRFVIPETEE